MASFMLALSGLAAAARIPAGTQIQIRLAKEVNTSTAKVGDAFGALVIAPVVADGQIVMAAGVTLTGHVKEAPPLSTRTTRRRWRWPSTRFATRTGKRPRLPPNSWA